MREYLPPDHREEAGEPARLRMASVLIGECRMCHWDGLRQTRVVVVGRETISGQRVNGKAEGAVPLIEVLHRPARVRSARC